MPATPRKSATAQAAAAKKTATKTSPRRSVYVHASVWDAADQRCAETGDAASMSALITQLLRGYAAGTIQLTAVGTAPAPPTSSTEENTQ
ncbi:hypothetical protein [Streptomyces triticirhizae]|uniref:Uncharacterized protein n=1 Tax=Streptomyces triticirhizae TaxID=2483353 RepID=A0A3M2M7B7_9ACTN|nr:hypothetical protein [Streptomyces triticirhizae]RMI44425.1 hypothetical protein EBN88_05340 [Streptomyces triticirhizae]